MNCRRHNASRMQNLLEVMAVKAPALAYNHVIAANMQSKVSSMLATGVTREHVPGLDSQY